MSVWDNLQPPEPVGFQVEPEMPEEPQAVVPTQVTEWKGLPVRADGDKVFLLKDGKKRWFTTKEAYENFGFKLGDEVKIDLATLSVIPEGEPIK